MVVFHSNPSTAYKIDIYYNPNFDSSPVLLTKITVQNYLNIMNNGLSVDVMNEMQPRKDFCCCLISIYNVFGGLKPYNFFLFSLGCFKVTKQFPVECSRFQT